jgi:hypothetical protein
MTFPPNGTLALADIVRQRLVFAATAHPDFDAREAIKVEAEALRVSEGEVESDT